MTLLKSLNAEQVKRFGLEKWLLGGVIAVAALSGMKAMSQNKPHRWFGEEK